MVKIVGFLFSICGLVLIIDEIDELESLEEWVDIIVFIWDFYLQGDGDVIEIIMYFFGDILLFVWQLENFGYDRYVISVVECCWIFNVYVFF